MADDDVSDSTMTVMAVETIQVPRSAVARQVLVDRVVWGRARSPLLLAGSHHHWQMEHLVEAGFHLAGGQRGRTTHFHLANTLDTTKDPAGLL